MKNRRTIEVPSGDPTPVGAAEFTDAVGWAAAIQRPRTLLSVMGVCCVLIPIGIWMSFIIGYSAAKIVINARGGTTEMREVVYTADWASQDQDTAIAVVYADQSEPPGGWILGAFATIVAAFCVVASSKSIINYRRFRTALGDANA
jgi:hypothetical protein